MKKKTPAYKPDWFYDRGDRRSSRIEHSDRVKRMDMYDAAQNGELKRVKELVKHGKDIEKRDSPDGTPLWVAAEFGYVDIVRYLVEQGADIESFGRGETPLMAACRTDNLDVVRYLVEQGADMEKNGNSNWTPLIYAVYNDRVNVVRYLLEQGANRDHADYYGDTPLHIAAKSQFCGNYEIAELLMAYGANLNAKNKRGYLPIDVAWDDDVEEAIRDEPRRRMDEAPGKRATEQDRHPNTITSDSAQEDEEEEEPSNKKARLNKGTSGQGKVAEEDEDSEPSDEEDDWGSTIKWPVLHCSVSFLYSF